ncbi:hypothetical protein H2248_011764 [Termitomyces sp. 'cryptogamus']|nr:hypothetical protein H2248_011764 [Termitomyces sp. 'cryptogamus']
MFKFPEPPTETSLTDARRVLSASKASVSDVETKIEAAEAALAKIVRESKSLIEDLQTQRNVLEQTITQTMAYLSPIRRLPLELLRNIFMECFEEHPCCAWVLAAVCGPWRRLVLRIPKIWSRIRLITTQHASADTIRLWLERSGDTVPLDIEIFLRVTSPSSGSDSPTRHRRRSRSRSRSLSPPPWHLPFPHQGIAAHYIVGHFPITPAGISAPSLVIPHPPTGISDQWLSMHHPGDRPTARQSRSSLHWGHIAIYYLAEQMHRWERFIFRFDKQFASLSALKSISGDAPLLKEFEVSSAETAYYPEWQWLPNAPPNAALVLPKLKTLTLQYTPFKWSSPMFRTNLHTLSLRALPACHLPLDRILFIVANNPSLESLTLHFQGALPAVLPLSPTTLPLIKTLQIGGHYTLAQLIDVFILPQLNSLTLDIEPRDPLEDTISNLLTRSSKPALTHLSIAYGNSSNTSSFYYGPSGIIISWPALLADLTHLESLRIGGTTLDPLLSSLSEEPWACPSLEALGMRNCHALGEGVVKLVAMVEARNPLPPTQGPVKRLKSLELYDCASVGEDVVAWLGSRVEEVACTEPEFDRSSMLHGYM